MVLLEWPPPDHLWIGRKSRQFLPSHAQACLREILRPELRLPKVAAQTRIVSVARIRLDSRKSVRPSKGIICDDISEFESYMPSHAVVVLGAPPKSSERSPRFRIVFANGRKAATSAVRKPELKGRNLASLQRGLFLL